jgi:chitodextrinase
MTARYTYTTEYTIEVTVRDILSASVSEWSRLKQPEPSFQRPSQALPVPTINPDSLEPAFPRS